MLDRKTPPRLSADQLMAMKLFEVADKLTDIYNELINQTPEGVIYGIPFTAGTTATKVVITYSATLYNDGAADIYILETDRTISSSDTPLKINESIALDFKRRGAKTYYIKTLAGTATIRIIALR